MYLHKIILEQHEFVKKYIYIYVYWICFNQEQFQFPLASLTQLQPSEHIWIYRLDLQTSGC